MPSRAKWSNAIEASIWPAMSSEMKVAAPSFGTSRIASATKIAPNRPPLQAHHGMRGSSHRGRQRLAQGNQETGHAEQPDEITYEAGPGG